MALGGSGPLGSHEVWRCFSMSHLFVEQIFARHEVRLLCPLQRYGSLAGFAHPAEQGGGDVKIPLVNKWMFPKIVVPPNHPF